MLSASANKLSRLKEQAEEYAALIMEELDPERLGYIEVCLYNIPHYIFIYIYIFCRVGWYAYESTEPFVLSICFQ